MTKSIIPQENIINQIIIIRNHKVILDRDIARLYQVETSALKRAVKRNISRFPKDFMFILNDSEVDQVVCHFGIPSKSVFGGSNPMVFTEQGVAMLSSVLRSETSVQVNIAIMRAFVHINKILQSNEKITTKLREIEDRMEKLENKQDKELVKIYKTLKQLIMQEEEESDEKIGFHLPGVN